MPFRPIQTSVWRKFLKTQGLVYIRTKGDHEMWNRPGIPLNRPVVFVSNERDVPPKHIQMNLRTLGISAAEFENILKSM